jgi:hypothetical protein
MSSEASRPRRTLTPSAQKRLVDAMPKDILAPCKKPTKPAQKRRSSIRVPTPPPDKSSSNEIEEEPMPRSNQRHEPTPIVLENLEYTVSCTTFFDEKKVWFDANTCHLGEFKVHDYNAKSIKAVAREAERMKTDFELSSYVATLSGARLKQTAKSLEDPNDWQTVERMIEKYMKDKIKSIRVNYVVNYIKKRRECTLSQRDAENDEESDDDEGSHPKKHKVCLQ